MEKIPARIQTTRAMLMLPVLWRTPPGETKIPLPMIDPTITVTPFNIVIVFFRPTAFASSGACTWLRKGVWGAFSTECFYLHLDSVLLGIFLAYHTVVFGSTVGSHLGNWFSLEKEKIVFITKFKERDLIWWYPKYMSVKRVKSADQMPRSDMLWLDGKGNVSEHIIHSQEEFPSLYAARVEMVIWRKLKRFENSASDHLCPRQSFSTPLKTTGFFSVTFIGTLCMTVLCFHTHI